MYEAVTAIRNKSFSAAVLIIEPWAHEIAMASGESLDVHARSPLPGAPEVVHASGCITYWAWPGATVEVRNGARVVESFGTAVPQVPHGASVRSFLRGLLGGDGPG